MSDCRVLYIRKLKFDLKKKNKKTKRRREKGMNVSYKVWNYFFLFGLLIFFVERVREKERIFSFFERDYMFYTLNLSHRGNGESVIIWRFFFI